MLLIYNEKISIFQPHISPEDTSNNILFLLSALVQSIASIITIAIVLLFISAQIITRPRYTRTIAEIYINPTTIIALFLLFIAITSNIILLGYVPQIVKSNDYRLIDFTIIIDITSILFLGLAMLVQIENLNPYLLASKISKKITAKRIRKYHLAQISVDETHSKRIHYTLITWGYEHGQYDPLGAFHEVIMGAVENRDRIQLSVLIQLMLRRTAKYCAVPYWTSPSSIPTPQSNVCRRVFNFLYIFTHIPSKLTNQAAVVLHILHYIIRRSRNLRREWGDLDAVRQQFVLNIGHLIQSLNLRRNTTQIIDICLFATMHVCLGYANVHHYGRLEPLNRYYQIAKELENRGKDDQAFLCAEILGLIVARTTQIPHEHQHTSERLLSPRLEREYFKAISTARANKNWFPGSEEKDPWHYRLSDYEFGSS